MSHFDIRNTSNEKWSVWLAVLHGVNPINSLSSIQGLETEKPAMADPNEFNNSRKYKGFNPGYALLQLFWQSKLALNMKDYGYL